MGARPNVQEGNITGAERGIAVTRTCFGLLATQENKSFSGDLSSVVRQQSCALPLGKGGSLALMPCSTENQQGVQKCSCNVLPEKVWGQIG